MTTTSTDLAAIARETPKHHLAVYLPWPEARRFEALAREHYHMKPATLLRRIALEELRRTRHVDLTEPVPITLQ